MGIPIAPKRRHVPLAMLGAIEIVKALLQRPIMLAIVVACILTMLAVLAMVEVFP